MTFTELAFVPSDPVPFTDRLRLAVAADLAASRAPPASTPNRTCAATCPGAPCSACPACGIFEATSADIADLGEEHGHRMLRVCGKGTKVVLVPPPAVGWAIDRAAGFRDRGPILLNTHSTRMDRHEATRRLRRLAEVAGIQVTKAHPHLLRHTYDHARHWR